MKIAIAGAGAMGIRFGLMLKKGGNDVLLIDGWEEHINKIKEDGLKVDNNGVSTIEEIEIAHQKEITMTDKIELVILFTKAMQLKEMLIDIKSLLNNNTKVLCLLNGIGHEDIIEDFVSINNIFIGNTMWTASLDGPGKVKLFGNGSVELQNLGGDSPQELATILSDSGLNAECSENIRYSVYRKACVNGTVNGLCSILDVNMAGLGETPTARKMIEKIVIEFSKVAEKENVQLNISEIVSYCETFFDRQTIGMHYPSMHQDLIQNNRPTEIDYINGVISRKGFKYGISTPYCDFLTELIHAKEKILEVN